jgi:hypothetical protein
VYTSLSPGRAKFGSGDEWSSGDEWGGEEKGKEKGSAKKRKKRKADSSDFEQFDEPPSKKKKDQSDYKNTGSKRTMVVGTVPDVQVRINCLIFTHLV